MNYAKTSEHIIKWLIAKAHEAKTNGFVVGVSGGVDSAVVSTLCAMTGLEVELLEMPIHRSVNPISERSHRHCKWLEEKGKKVRSHKFDLTAAFNGFTFDSPMGFSELALSNLRSRLRMCALYSVANTKNLLVVGTGNKVEDFGVGFFTKHGDGGCDISPIGELTKTQVWEMARFLDVSIEIIDAAPTDELWADTRSDEDQIGATYDELEWAMKFIESKDAHWVECLKIDLGIHAVEDVLRFKDINQRQLDVLKIYIERHEKNAHKMSMPPICSLDGVYG